jgi:hypothetical protein
VTDGSWEDRPSRARVKLTDISSRAWEHPADRGALTALRQLRGFDYVLRKLAGLWNERALRLVYLGAAVRVDHRQFPGVYQLYTQAAAPSTSVTCRRSTCTPTRSRGPWPWGSTGRSSWSTAA